MAGKIFDYDYLCLSIISEISKKGQINLWDFMKNYKWDDKPLNINSINCDKRDGYLVKKYSKVKKKLRDMETEGLVLKKDFKNEIRYYINRKSVIKKIIELPDGKKERIIIKTSDNRWIIFNIEEG